MGLLADTLTPEADCGIDEVLYKAIMRERPVPGLVTQIKCTLCGRNGLGGTKRFHEKHHDVKQSQKGGLISSIRIVTTITTTQLGTGEVSICS